MITYTAMEYLRQADIRVLEETLTDGSKVYNLHIGEREFPCFSEGHANRALMDIAAALAYASNGPRFDYTQPTDPQ